MKTTALTILLGLSLTLGSAITSPAEGSNTVRIPQGRGQYIEVQAAAKTPAPVAAKTCAHSGCKMDHKSACCHS